MPTSGQYLGSTTSVTIGKETIEVVTVQVCNEHRIDFERVDTVADQLSLGILATIYQKKLLTHIECVSRGMLIGCGFCRTIAKYGYTKTHRLSLGQLA